MLDTQFEKPSSLIVQLDESAPENVLRFYVDKENNTSSGPWMGFDMQLDLFGESISHLEVSEDEEACPHEGAIRLTESHSVFISSSWEIL